jgi:hemerythrin-like metal-binding protein
MRPAADNNPRRPFEMADSFVMTTFQWTADYAVGVRQIDEEHQRLFALAEKVHRAMLEGEGKAILQALLAGLVAYTSYHFAHEEQLMERIGYPGYREHRAQHEDLRSRAREMQDRLASGELTITIEVIQFLMEWVRKHIASSDCRIAAYMKKSRRWPV